MMFPTKWQTVTMASLDCDTAPLNSSLELLLSTQILTKTKSPQHRTPTAKLLEDLNKRLVRRISEHNWDHPDFTELMADDYRAHVEYQEVPYVVGRDNYIKNYRAFADAHPAYRLEPISTIADVHENNSTAVVWMLMKVDGHPKDVQRESVTLAYWRRRAGRWQAYKQTGIRAAGGCLEPT